MGEKPPSKGVKLLSSAKLLNFVHWLATYYPSIRSLSSLDDPTLLRLANEFEQDREDLGHDKAVSWQESITELARGNNSYPEARAVLEKRL